MPIPGRERRGRAATTVERPDSVSPASTGFFHSMKSMPGDPSDEELESQPSNIMRMKMLPVCQPEAERPPRMLALPAASSRCMGCGSNSAANSTISSAVTGRSGSGKLRPGVKSSKK